jgi:hypothetical protein
MSDPDTLRDELNVPRCSKAFPAGGLDVGRGWSVGLRPFEPETAACFALTGFRAWKSRRF